MSYKQTTETKSVLQINYKYFTKTTLITYEWTTETMPKKQKDIQLVNVRIPKEIISILDSLVKNNLYSSRSEAIREFSREYVLDNRMQK